MQQLIYQNEEREREKQKQQLENCNILRNLSQRKHNIFCDQVSFADFVCFVGMPRSFMCVCVPVYVCITIFKLIKDDSNEWFVHKISSVEWIAYLFRIAFFRLPIFNEPAGTI